SMTKAEKAELLEELKEKFTQNSYFYVMDGAGMTVQETNNFRRTCFDKGIEYQVIKNSLIKKALESVEGDFTELNEKVLKGFSGVLFSAESGSAPAKMIKDYRKKTGKEVPVLKGASIDASVFVGEESLDTMSKVRSKADVIAELVGILQSPGRNLASALQAPGKNLASALNSGGGTLAGLLKAIAEKKEKEA
ncbi:MAG: 50S ribosomal protein L10, partial [Bacteroidota bacterium]